MNNMKSQNSLFDFSPFRTMLDDFEKNFSGFFTKSICECETMGTSRSNSPEVDVLEKEDCFELEVVLAGFKKDNISLKLDNNKLYMLAQQSEKKRSGKYLIREISKKSFSRVFQFAAEIDVTNVTSVFKDGVLKCILPKVKPGESKKYVKIEIN